MDALDVIEIDEMLDDVAREEHRLALADSAVPIGPYLLMERALCRCEALCTCGWDA